VVDVAANTRGDLTATAPVLIAEVLSPSSERIDLGDKAAEYLRLPSLRAYLVFAQDQMNAWVWLRGSQAFAPSPQDFAPSPNVVEGEDARLHITSLGIDVPFTEIYERVRLG
jgi:Uma2 family endonuclease